MIAITNCKVFKEEVLLEGQNVLINNGKVIQISQEKPSKASQVIDAQGSLLSRGFVELQIYGSGGNLFSAYPTAETLAQMDEDLISKGTTGFLACVATNSRQVVLDSISAAKDYRTSAKGFLGLHLEGPYLNPKRLGAHMPEFVEKATLDGVKRLLEVGDGTIRMMTIAAELQDDDVIQYLLDNGILLSLGHSDATFAEATSAYNKGVKTTTHLFNAMPSIHHRTPNLPTAVFNHPTAMSSIIADGLHVDFEVVKMAYRTMGPRLFLITDAVTACTVGPYQHRLEGDKFVTAEGTLSGSNITLMQAVKNIVTYCGVPLREALNMASIYPHNLLNNTLEEEAVYEGMKADLILISDDLVLEKAFVSGVEHLVSIN